MVYVELTGGDRGLYGPCVVITMI